MLNKKISELINNQINKELESAYLYLGFANFFTEKSLEGFAHWYTVQAYEEIDHAKKFMDYLHDNNDIVDLETIQVLDHGFDGILEVLAKGLNHELYVTALINNIYKEAIDLRDFRTKNFLEWFIAEQAEEEKNAQALIEMYNNFVKDCSCDCGLYVVDRELGKRN